MSNTRTIPSAAPKSASTFTLLSNGNEVSRAYQVLSITVNKQVNRIPAATIILLDGEASQQTFNISNQADFEPGAELEIKAGYRGNEDSIFKGIVIGHSIKVRKKTSVLMIEARDKAVKMTTRLKSRYFTEMADSDAIEQIIQEHGLESDIASTDVTHHEIVQHQCTDWDFMLCRADVNGLLCLVNEGKLTLQKPDLGQEAALEVQYGATVKDLDAEIDARLQFDGVTATAWNPADQDLVEAVEADDPSTPQAGNIPASDLAAVAGSGPLELSHGGRITEPELKAWADARLLKQRLARIRGSVRIDGTPDIAPGQLINLSGVGDRFEGDLFASGVRHEIQKGNWETVVQFGFGPEWFAEVFKVEQPPAGAMLPPVHGLQIGVVTALEGDPDGEERIKVRVPVFHASDEGSWARIATLDAGDSRGTVFRPEIGDEVIVGFLNRDPRHPVVLGMCHSSAKPAPIPAADANHEKGYVSREKMRIHFDDEKKDLLIETPAGNKLLLSEDGKKVEIKDQHGNSITMDQDGIRIESIKDLQLKAAVEWKAQGTNTSLESSAQMTVKGGATAEFSSGGNTALKGALVNIN